LFAGGTSRNDFALIRAQKPASPPSRLARSIMMTSGPADEEGYYNEDQVLDDEERGGAIKRAHAVDWWLTKLEHMEMMPNEPTLISEIHLSSMYTHYCTDADALWPNSPSLHSKRAITTAQPTPTHPRTPARHRRAQERLHSRHAQGGLALRSSPRIVSFAHFG